MIPLADAIAALREQLTEARQRRLDAVEAAREAGETAPIAFAVGPVEIELNLVVEREAGAEGKIGFKIFGWGTDVSASGKLGDQRSHKVKITLTPQAEEEGGFLLVGDRK